MLAVLKTLNPRKWVCLQYSNPYIHTIKRACSSQNPKSTQPESFRALGNAPAEGSGDQPSQAPPSRPPAPSSSSQSVEPRRTDSLEYIQSWLDTNPEGQWSPFPFSHQPSPVKSQPEGLERQTPAQQLPSTPEAKRPAQRALQFSPMSVTQPGAEVMHANLGKLYKTCLLTVCLCIIYVVKQKSTHKKNKICYRNV